MITTVSSNISVFGISKPPVNDGLIGFHGLFHGRLDVRDTTHNVTSQYMQRNFLYDLFCKESDSSTLTHEISDDSENGGNVPACPV